MNTKKKIQKYKWKIKEIHINLKAVLFIKDRVKMDKKKDSLEQTRKMD